MKKIESLLKKVELFEKLAVYGNRKTFLNSLAQEMSEVDPNDPSKEKSYSGTYDASKNPVPNTVVPEMTFYAPKQNRPVPNTQNPKAIENVTNVMKQYMSDPNYSSKPEVVSKIDKLWSSFYGMPSSGALGSLTTVNQEIKELSDYLSNRSPYDNEGQAKADLAQKKLNLFRLRQQDIKNRMGVKS